MNSWGVIGQYEETVSFLFGCFQLLMHFPLYTVMKWPSVIFCVEYRNRSELAQRLKYIG